MRSFNPYGTHQEVLLSACRQTTGPIVELGCGWNGPEHVKKAVDETFKDKRIVGSTWTVKM